MSETFKVVPTPNPEKWAFVVKVSTQELRPGMEPKVGSKYEDIGIGERKRVGEGWGDYRYAETRPSQDDGMIELLFVPPDLPTELDEDGLPKPFRVTPSETQYNNWPPFLETNPRTGNQIDFVSDNDGFPITYTRGAAGSGNYVNTVTPRVHVDYLLRPQWNGATRIEKREYLTSKPLPAEMLATNVPIPNTIRFELLADLNPDVREITCLHGEITIPSLGSISTDNGSTQGYKGALLQGRNYAETNMTEWETHVYSVDQQYENGFYYTQIMVAFAPPMEPLTTD
jgi:hypothetical protein